MLRCGNCWIPDFPHCCAEDFARIWILQKRHDAEPVRIGLPVNFQVVSGPATLTNSTVAINGAGLVVIRASQPGDVISFDNPYVGHVAVVAASNVNSAGDGSITMLSQNDTADGWRTLAVSHWRVASFGNQTPYGWLHDPAGRGNPTHIATDAGYWMVEASGTGRLGTPDDIAAAVEFLLSPAASFITGVDLLVDGGAVAAVRTGQLG